ncbi:MAG: hypothetical protein ABIE47_02090 [Pseudomonadota bacterium]
MDSIDEIRQKIELKDQTITLWLNQITETRIQIDKLRVELEHAYRQKTYELVKPLLSSSG